MTFLLTFWLEFLIKMINSSPMICIARVLSHPTILTFNFQVTLKSSLKMAFTISLTSKYLLSQTTRQVFFLLQIPLTIKFLKPYTLINPHVRIFHINLVIALSFNISFRKCVSGEITYDNRCKICPRGYYSFEPTSSECI